MALNLKMVKTDSLAVPGSNRERRWNDRSCRKTGSVTLISGSVNGYIRTRAVRPDGYRIIPVEEKGT
jgi:hypothetical protein